jgi:hypothetical protein
MANNVDKNELNIQKRTPEILSEKKLPPYFDSTVPDKSVIVDEDMASNATNVENLDS